MSWDIHFIRDKKIGEVLEDNEFKIRCGSSVCVIYTIDDGEESGLVFPHVTEEDYKDKGLNYGYANYGANVRPFLYKLYKKFGVLFADTCLDDYWYLQEYCESNEEEQDLLRYCCANEMLHMFSPYLDDDPLLKGYMEKGIPLYDKLYEKYKRRK